MRQLAINSGDAFILVYSVDDPQSFDELEQLRQMILNERERAHLEASASSSSASIATSSATSSTSGLGSVGELLAVATTGGGNGSQQALATSSGQLLVGVSQPPDHQQPSGAPEMSPSRHWSLASLFNHNQPTASCNNYQQQHHHHHHQSNHNSLLGSISASSTSNNNCNSLHTANGPPSASSSHYSSASSCCSSADNSRRSSVSAAEAALKTRRTRRPPMVIVANKHDLPRDKHLVNSDEIEALAVIDWNNGFVRASAALNWNIDEIFQQVLKQARQPPTLAEAIVSKRRKSLPPKLPHP